VFASVDDIWGFPVIVPVAAALEAFLLTSPYR
jgi:hypothetical protein